MRPPKARRIVIAVLVVYLKRAAASQYSALLAAKRGEPSISSRGVNLGSASRPCSYCSSAACGVFRKLIAIRL